MNREAQHQDNIKRFLAEGRTVSGGDGNGPGKPGYEVVTISDDDTQAEQTLNNLADAGYQILFAVPFSQNGQEIKTRVILGNYKKD